MTRTVGKCAVEGLFVVAVGGERIGYTGKVRLEDLFSNGIIETLPCYY